MPGNTVAISGTLGADPELRYTQSGRPVCGMRIASNRRYQRNGEWEEETTWFSITAWGDLGENCAQSLMKGVSVDVQGRFKESQYTDKDGNERKSFEVVADTVGPSLRWATCEVTKVKRDKPDAGAAPRPQAQASPVYDETEPF